MTAEEITHDILDALKRGEMPAAEAFKRLIAAGVDADDARELVRSAEDTDLRQLARRLFSVW